MPFGCCQSVFDGCVMAEWIGLDLFNDDTCPSGHISRPTLVNVSQGCLNSLNNYSGLIILSTSGGYLKLINYIISDRRILLLAGIPLCKSQELSQREHSTSRLCSIHHDIPVTMHTPAAYGQWSVFDHSGGNQSAVLGTRYGIWWPWYGQFEVGWLVDTLATAVNGGRCLWDSVVNVRNWFQTMRLFVHRWHWPCCQCTRHVLISATYKMTYWLRKG